MSKKIKIGYFADGPWAHRAFEKIIRDETIEISFICVRYSKKDYVLQELGEKYKIDILSPQNINSSDFIYQIKKYKVDLFVSMSYDQIFKNELINLSPLKTINCHAGKLPYYRGRNILNWVLINDEKEFGITVHYMDEGIDTGDIILQKVYEITDEDTYATLLERAYEGCAEILYDAIKVIQYGKVRAIKQDDVDKIGIYCGGRREGDEILDWNQTSRNVFNFVRALCIPGPQALSFINGKPIKINKVKLVEGAHKYKGIPGQVIGKGKEGLYIKTQDSMIELIEYSFEGNIKISDRLSNRLDQTRNTISNI